MYQPVPGVAVTKSCAVVDARENSHSPFLLPFLLSPTPISIWNFMGQNMQSRTSSASVGSSLKFCSRQRKGLQVEAFPSLGKAGTPWAWSTVWSGWQRGEGRYLQEQLVLSDPLDGLNQVGRDGVGQTVPLLYLLQGLKMGTVRHRGPCARMSSGRRWAGLRREEKREKATQL